MPELANVTWGSALTSVRRFRVTQLVSPLPLRIATAFSSLGASTPAAKRQRSVSPSGWNRKSAQPDHGTIFEIFDEISAIVSDTPRLVPIDCAISYSA